MDYQTKCGCIVVERPPNFKIKYCPKHGAALSMYEALGVARAFITEGTKPQREKALLIIGNALAKAEGK